MRAIVLAGGLGTRLKERVADLPKPMATVAGRPFLEYVLDRLVHGGITDIVLSVGYRADAITGHFGESYRGARLSYSIEKELLGTGGAILKATAARATEPHLILNGDTLLALDYAKFIDWYEAAPADMAMVLRAVPDVARYGAVLVSGEKVTGFTEKGRHGPGLINAGVYIMRPQLFEAHGLSGKFSLEADLLMPFAGQIAPRAFVTDSYFIDIGIPEDFDRAQHELPSIA